MAVYGTGRYAPRQGRFISLKECAKCVGYKNLDEWENLFDSEIWHCPRVREQHRCDTGGRNIGLRG